MFHFLSSFRLLSSEPVPALLSPKQHLVRFSQLYSSRFFCPPSPPPPYYFDTNLNDSVHLERSAREKLHSQAIRNSRLHLCSGAHRANESRRESRKRRKRKRRRLFQYSELSALSYVIATCRREKCENSDSKFSSKRHRSASPRKHWKQQQTLQGGKSRRM